MTSLLVWITEFIPDGWQADLYGLCLWRLERQIYIDTWDNGIGAELGGGRWNSKGQAAVDGSLDASTAILEVGFQNA